MADLNQTSQYDNLPFTCSYCKRSYYASPVFAEKPCPLCQKGKLENNRSEIFKIEPEKILPFKINKSRLQSILSNFVSGVWIKPTEFKPETLLSRALPIFWPLWLVDCDVAGNWQMEAGFDYQVESAKETFANGQWRSIKQIKERIRWEPRLGQVATRVENVVVPALEEHQNRMTMTGNYPDKQAEPYKQTRKENILLEVPDIPTQKAWRLAKPLVNEKIDEICQKASGAQHSEKFTLNAEYHNPNWTQSYLPMFVTYYKDDNEQPQILIINGQTGQINGPRLASPKRGLKIAGMIAIGAGILLMIALLTFLLSLAISEVKTIAAFFGILGVGTGLTALIPALWPVLWNRNQTGPRLTNRE